MHCVCVCVHTGVHCACTCATCQPFGVGDVCEAIIASVSTSVDDVGMMWIEQTRKPHPNPKPLEKLRIVDGGPFFPHDP